MASVNDWYELQYKPSLTVRNAASVAPGWRRRSAATRERLQPMSDFKYGPHPRENLDLFRARNPGGTVVFVHGGYWQLFSKLEFSFVAEGFVKQGYSVAMVNYPLCPDVPLAHIRGSVQRAFAVLWSRVLNEAERRVVVVAGHSAGGHLAVLHLATDWRQFNLPENPIAGVVSLSGVFDVAPLIHTSINDALRLTGESAETLNLMRTEPRCAAPLLLAVGGDEPEEFHRQSGELAKSWATLRPNVLSLAGINHYTIVDELAEPGALLNGEVLAIANWATRR
jgi:arylformamidase